MDIDFTTDLSSGFNLSLGTGGSIVTGNRALVNRFELTFMTDIQSFVFNGVKEVDTFGGNANSNIARPTVLTDVQAIASGVQASISSTVESLKSNQDGLPATEQIDTAVLTGIDIIQGVVTIGIQIIPVETQAWATLSLNLPITRYSDAS